MWVLYGKYAYRTEFGIYYRTARIAYTTRSAAVKGSRQFHNNALEWIPKCIQYERFGNS